jgi:hypothetical protein
MRWTYNDGGRKLAGHKGEARDCVTRAVAIAAELPYADVYAVLSAGAGAERKSKGSTARNGIRTRRKWFSDYMTSIGWGCWTPTMGIGTGCKVHLRDGELPMGRLVVNVSRHLVAVIDGMIHDTSDPSRGGNRCVYGYWTKAAVPSPVR